MDEKKIISDDSLLSEKEKKELTSKGSIPITSMEQLEELAKAACDRFSGFEGDVEQMTSEQATLVRELRVVCGCSWRSVAENCYSAYQFHNWKNKDNWYPQSNQLMGMALCQKAAEFFNENYEKEPWN